MIETGSEIGVEQRSDYIGPVSAAEAYYGGGETSGNHFDFLDSGEDTGDDREHDHVGDGEFTDRGEYETWGDTLADDPEKPASALGHEFTDSDDRANHDRTADMGSAENGGRGSDVSRGLGSLSLNNTGTDKAPHDTIEATTEAAEPDSQVTDPKPSNNMDIATVTVRDRAPEPEREAKAELELGEAGKLIATSPMLEDFIQPITPEAFELLRADHVWELEAAGPDGRGFRIEDAMAEMWQEDHPNTIHLQPRHPTVDLWDPTRRAVTSVKSLDPASPTYEDPSRLEAKVRHYLKLAKDYSPTSINGQPTYTRSIQKREVALALPDTGFTEEHLARLEIVTLDAIVWNIVLSLVEIPR